MLGDLLGPGVDLLGGGIALLDADGRIVHANPALGELLGAPADALVGELLSDRAHPDDQAAVRDAFTAARSSRELEWRCPHPDGRVLHLLQVTTIVTDDAGLAPTHVLAQFTDVSRSRQVEFALRRQTELYESLVEGLDVLGDGVAVVDDSSVLFVNPALARMLGYPQEQLVGRPWSEALVPRESQKWWKRAWQVSSAIEDLPDRYDLTVNRSDGRQLEVEVTIRQVRPDTALRMLVLRDVSERNHRFAEQLQLAAIVEASSDAIGSVDTDGCVTRWNPGAEAIFGRARDEVAGTRFVELFPEPVRAAVDDGLLRAREGEMVQLEVDASREGDPFDMSMSMSPLRDGGGDVIGVAIVGHDVTEQRRLERERARFAEKLQVANEELEHANQVRSEFVSMASHELRTPLTTIHGFAATMLDLWDEVNDDEKLRFLDIIDSQALRLSRLVDNLLTASRFESGRSSLHPRPYDVRDELVRILDPLAINGLELRCADDLVVTNDPDHFEQIVVNLVVNAQKYGAAPFAIDVAKEAAELHLRVCDSGAGVDESFVPMLFDSFTRSPESTALEVEGAGLGLAIVRWLAEESGGRAWYEPNHPTGACFCVTLHDFGADDDQAGA